MKKSMKTKDRIKAAKYFRGKSPENFLSNLKEKALDIEKQINRNETNLLIGKNRMYVSKSGIVSGPEPEQTSFKKIFCDLRSNTETLIYDIKRLAEISRSLAGNEITISDNAGGIFQMQDMIISNIKAFQSGSI